MKKISKTEAIRRAYKEVNKYTTWNEYHKALMQNIVPHDRNGLKVARLRYALTLLFNIDPWDGIPSYELRDRFMGQSVAQIIFSLK